MLLQMYASIIAIDIITVINLIRNIKIKTKLHFLIKDQ